MYQKWFLIPEKGKIPERVMLNRIAVSIATIVLCMAAMSFSAYAFFTSTVTSKAGVLQSAKYELDVRFEEAVTEENGVYLLNNDTDSAKRFSFSIFAQPENTATVGYAMITADQVTDFYTQPIWSVEETEKTAERSYSIDVAPNSTVRLIVAARWGSYSGTPAEEGVLIDLSHLNSIQADEEQPTEEHPSEEQPSEEQPSEEAVTE